MKKALGRVEDLCDSYLMEHKNDSVSKCYKILIKADLNECKYYLRAGFFEMVYNSNYEQAIMYYNDALKYSIVEKEKAISYFYLGQVYQAKSDYTRALYYYEQPSALIKNMPSERNEFLRSIYVSLGNIYSDKAEYEKALNYFEQALSLQSENYCLEDLFIYSGIGGVFTDLKKYDQAMEYYNKALNIFDKSDVKYIAYWIDLQNSIGLVHYYKGEYIEALESLSVAKNVQLKFMGEKDKATAGVFNNWDWFTEAWATIMRQ